MTEPEARWDPVWEDLPVDARTAMLDRGAEAWTRVNAGVATHNTVWRPIRSPMATTATYEALVAVADRVVGLALEACRRRASTAGELRTRLGVPAGHVRLLDDDQPVSEDLMVSVRPDVLISDGVPRFVELNVDGALGGAFDCDTMAARFVAEYATAPGLDGVDVRAAPSAVIGRFQAMRAALGLADGARVVMALDFDSGYPGMAGNRDRFLAALAPVSVTARTVGLDLVPYPVDALTVDADRRLLAQGRPVDAVFRMCIPDAVPHSAGLDALATALRADTVRIFTASATWLLGDKQVLGWVWDDLATLPTADRALVERHLPYTALCTAQEVPAAVADREDLVLKPAGGTGGAGVVIGREVDADGWRKALDAAVAAGAAGARYVLQRYVTQDRLPMHFVDTGTGVTTEAEVPWCVGPFLFGRKGSGAAIRLGIPGGGSVVNIGQGALWSGLLLVDP